MNTNRVSESFRRKRIYSMPRPRGASLIELMVSLFVFTIGVLGFASLQSRSLQGTFDNGQRDQVVWMTQSLVDRIRINKDQSAGYAALLSDFGANSCTTSIGTPPSCGQTGGAAATECTATQMVTYDVWDVVCSNNFQGASATKGLEIDLSCAGTCEDTDLTLSTTWCSRGIESAEGLNAAESDSCANTVAQMRYTLSFRP